MKFLKFYVLYEFFQFFGLLCVVSSLDVNIGDTKLLQAGVVVLLFFVEILSRLRANMYTLRK